VPSEAPELPLGGLYSDAESLLPALERERVLRHVRKAPPPHMAARAASRIMESFLASPHFRSWFGEARSAVIRELRAVMREAIKMTSPQELVRSLIVGNGGDHVTEADVVPLALRIRTAMAEECQRNSEDGETRAQMQRHLDAVESLLSPRMATAVRSAAELGGEVADAPPQPQRASGRWSGSAEHISEATDALAHRTSRSWSSDSHAGTPSGVWSSGGDAPPS